MEEIKPFTDNGCSTNANLPNDHSKEEVSKDTNPRTSQNDKVVAGEQQSANLQHIDILGAVKVKDGFFLGDEFAS